MGRRSSKEGKQEEEEKRIKYSYLPTETVMEMTKQPQSPKLSGPQSSTYFTSRMFWQRCLKIQLWVRFARCLIRMPSAAIRACDILPLALCGHRRQLSHFLQSLHLTYSASSPLNLLQKKSQTLTLSSLVMFIKFYPAHLCPHRHRGSAIYLKQCTAVFGWGVPKGTASALQAVTTSREFEKRQKRKPGAPCTVALCQTW